MRAPSSAATTPLRGRVPSAAQPLQRALAEHDQRPGGRGRGRNVAGARGNMFFSADDPRWLVDLLRRGRLGAVRREVAAMAAAYPGAPERMIARSMLLPELIPPRSSAGGASARGARPYADLALSSAGVDAEAVIRGLDHA